MVKQYLRGLLRLPATFGDVVLTLQMSLSAIVYENGPTNFVMSTIRALLTSARNDEKILPAPSFI